MGLAVGQSFSLIVAMTKKWFLTLSTDKMLQAQTHTHIHIHAPLGTSHPIISFQLLKKTRDIQVKQSEGNHARAIRILYTHTHTNTYFQSTAVRSGSPCQSASHSRHGPAARNTAGLDRASRTTHTQSATMATTEEEVGRKGVKEE